MTRRTKPPGCYVGKEDDFQISVVNWIRSQYPNVLMNHTPNGAGILGGKSTGARIAKLTKLKKMGVSKGFPDLSILEPTERYHALYLELKIWPNKPTPEQLEWHRQLRDRGNRVATCYGLDEVIEIVKEYGNDILV